MKFVISLILFFSLLNVGLFSKNIQNKNIQEKNISIPFTLEDRDRIINLHAELHEIRVEFNSRFESIDKNFETKFESLYQRFDSIENELSFIKYLLIALITAMFGLVGFILWDRRTYLKPVIDDTKDLEKKSDQYEEIFRELAKYQPELAPFLKSKGIL